VAMTLTGATTIGDISRASLVASGIR